MYLFGASGHAKVIMDILDAMGLPIDALIDDNETINELHGYDVLHGVVDASPIIVSIGNNAIRKKVVNKLTGHFGKAVHPTAIVSPSASVDEGTVVMQGAIIQADAVVGKHCIVNTGASVDHECVLEAYVHISPHATLCGNVTVGEGAWVGAGATIIPGVKIGAWAVVGAGAVVVRDVEPHTVVAGVPAEVIKGQKKIQKDIAIYGAGGLGREVACLISMINETKEIPEWNFIGFFDDDSSLYGTQNEYGTVIGGINELNRWNNSIDIVIAVGSPNAVKAIANKITNPLVEFPNIIAPSVTFFDKMNVKMGKGNIISTNCTISCNVTIGDFNLFNGYIPVGHDAEIGNFNVIMPSSNISGGVKMGNCNFMGTQSVVLQNLKIGNHVRIGANSVIMRNTKDGLLYMGNPAKKMEL